MSGFITKHGLWTQEQAARAEEILEQIRKDGIQRIRIGWGDQHGIVRGKVLTADEFARACVDGKDFQLVTAIFDPTNHPIVPPFSDNRLREQRKFSNKSEKMVSSEYESGGAINMELSGERF